MIHELRIYTALPGRMPALLTRFREHTCALFDKHGIRHLVYWTNLIGGASDELWYLVEFDSLAHRESAWAAFHSDPAWIRARDRSVTDGPIVARFESRIMQPTDFSALGRTPFVPCEEPASAPSSTATASAGHSEVS
jgi:NIPSNAP